MMRYRSDSATTLGIVLLAIIAWIVLGLTLVLVL